MQRINSILNLLEPSLALCISGLKETEKEKINEIRLRKSCPLSVTVKNKTYFIGNKPYLLENEKEAKICSDIWVEESFLGLTRHSVYAYEDQISKGYISLPLGCRAGIGGSLVEGKEDYRLSNIFSLNIRIAREFIGCSKSILPCFLKDNKLSSGIIISPPCGGKTTILRDLARSISNSGKKVTVIDERGELTGMHNGKPTMDIGINTDVLCGVKKEDGIVMACRSLSPDVIIFDEIGKPNEALAVRDALNCGVYVIMSVHSQSIGQAFLRKQVSLLLEAGVIDVCVLLEGALSPGKVKEIYYTKENKNENVSFNSSLLLPYNSGLS